MYLNRLCCGCCLDFVCHPVSWNPFWFENWHDFCHFLNFVVLQSGDVDSPQKNSLHMRCSTLSSRHTETQISLCSSCTKLCWNLILPLALQPTVGFGLSNNVLPFFPICHQLHLLTPSTWRSLSASFFRHFLGLPLLLPLALQPTVGFGLSNNVLPFFSICHQLSPSSHSQHLKISFCFLFPSFPGSSPSPSIGTTAHCGLWPVKRCPSIFSYLPPTLSIFSLPALAALFLLPLSIFSWVFPFFSSLPVLEWRSFWASYPPPFSLGDLTSLSFAFYPFYYIFSFAHLF